MEIYHPLDEILKGLEDLQAVIYLLYKTRLLNYKQFKFKIRIYKRYR